MFETAIKTLRITLRRDCRAMIKNDTMAGKGSEPADDEQVQPMMSNIPEDSSSSGNSSGGGKTYKKKAPNETGNPNADGTDGKEAAGKDKKQHAKSQQAQADEANTVIVASQYQDKVKQIEEDRRQQEHWMNNMAKQGKGELIRETMAAGGPSVVATAQAAAKAGGKGKGEGDAAGDATKSASNATDATNATDAAKNATNATNATGKNATKAEDGEKNAAPPEKVEVRRKMVDELVKKNSSASHMVVKPQGDEAFDYQKQKREQDKARDAAQDAEDSED